MEINGDYHSSQKAGKEPKESFPICEVVAAAKSKSVHEPTIPDNHFDTRMLFRFETLGKKYSAFANGVYARKRFSNGEQATW
jgi:hypothetical protein